MRNILIEGTGVYIPKNKVYNEELDKHFEKKGLSAHRLMEHFLFPSNAMRIVGLYGEKMRNIKIAFDLNSNCTGMVQGLDVVYKYISICRCQILERLWLLVVFA